MDSPKTFHSHKNNKNKPFNSIETPIQQSFTAIILSKKRSLLWGQNPQKFHLFCTRILIDITYIWEFYNEFWNVIALKWNEMKELEQHNQE